MGRNDSKSPINCPSGDPPPPPAKGRKVAHLNCFECSDVVVERDKILELELVRGLRAEDLALFHEPEEHIRACACGNTFQVMSK